MATILRSSKYARCLNLYGRRIAAGNDNPEFARKLVALQARSINPYLAKCYATAPSVNRKEGFGNFNYAPGNNYLSKLDENIQRYGRVFKPEIDAALSKYRERGNISSLDALLLIRSCGDLLVDMSPPVKNQLVQEIWSTVEALGAPIDVSHFNALLGVYVENGYDFSPIDILTKMKEKGIEPDRVTYQRLIMHYCNKGDIEGATKILEFMSEKGLPLTESIFSALITGHSEANDMESAKNMLNVMKSAGVQPSTNTYTALMCAYAKRADLDPIKKLMNECTEKHLYLTDKDIFKVIHVLAANGHDSAVDELLPLISKSVSYNANACHAILKILDVGNVNVAMKILPTMTARTNPTEESDSATNESGTFLVRKLVNSEFPFERIVEVCEQLETLGYHTRPFEIALHRSLSNSNVTLSIDLLKAYKQRGVTIREHYLWPLFVAHGAASNTQGVLDVLKFMALELNILPGAETIAEYILPYNSGGWNELIETLKEYHVPDRTIYTAIAVRMLVEGRIRKTADFMSYYPTDYEVKLIYRPLSDALRITEDTKSFIRIVWLLHNGAANRANASNANEGTNEKSEDLDGENVIDTAVRRAFEILPVGKTATPSTLLDDLVEAGMSITSATGEEIIKRHFSYDLTPEISEKIAQLTSGTLKLQEPPGLNTKTPGNESNNIRDADFGGKHTFNLPVLGMKTRLIKALEAKNVEEVKSLAEKLDAVGLTLAPASFAQIIETFSVAGDLEHAEKWMNKYKSTHPDRTLDIVKIMKYATLLIKENRFEDAIKFIVAEMPQGNALSRFETKHVYYMLHSTAETGNVENTNKLFETLKQCNYCTVDKLDLRPLVSVHLARDDLQGALEAFEKICLTYKRTPMKNVLSKKFIEAEDASSLQRLTDLSTEVHGESNSLMDLVVAFIECGRLRQARKILETPLLKLRPGKFRSIAMHYIEENQYENLERFIEMTKDLQITNRQEIYDVLIDIFNKKNDWQRGLSLWMVIQEENIQPSPMFLDTLRVLLTQNEKKVPFAYEDKSSATSAGELLSEYLKFNKAMEQGDLDKAEEIFLNAETTDSRYENAVSRLINAFLKKKMDVNRASKFLKTALINSKPVTRSTVDTVLSALFAAQQYDEVRSYEEILTSAKTKSWFMNAKVSLELHDVGLSEFLSNLERKSTDLETHASDIRNHLPFNALLDALKKEPSALPQFRSIAEKLANHGILKPINVVWCYHFERNEPEADEIWANYLASSRGIKFNSLIPISKSTNNIDLMERLHEKIMNAVIADSVKAFTLASLIDMYNSNNCHKDALKVLHNSSPKIVEIISREYRNTMNQLRQGLQASGMTFSPKFIANEEYRTLSE